MTIDYKRAAQFKFIFDQVDHLGKVAMILSARLVYIGRPELAETIVRIGGRRVPAVSEVIDDKEMCDLVDQIAAVCQRDELLTWTDFCLAIWNEQNPKLEVALRDAMAARCAS